MSRTFTYVCMVNTIKNNIIITVIWVTRAVAVLIHAQIIVATTIHHRQVDGERHQAGVLPWSIEGPRKRQPHST